MLRLLLSAIPLQLTLLNWSFLLLQDVLICLVLAMGRPSNRQTFVIIALPVTISSEDSLGVVTATAQSTTSTQPSTASTELRTSISQPSATFTEPWTTSSRGQQTTYAAPQSNKFTAQPPTRLKFTAQPTTRLVLNLL